MKTNLNEQESLNLITEMITQTRDNFQKGSGNNTIFWGYLTVAFSIINYVLIYLLENHNYAYMIWTLMFPIGIAAFAYNMRKTKKALVVTHFDKIISWIWGGFFIANICAVSAIYILSLWLRTETPLLLIIPIIMNLIALGLFVTSKVCRFKPYANGAIVLWIGSIVSIVLSLQFEQNQIQLLILAICMLVGYIVPGHMLNRKAEHDV